jgi:hypothetical protein
MSAVPAISPVPVKRHRWKRITALAVGGVFVLWTAFVGFMWRAMHKPPEDFGRVMSHMPAAVFLVAPFETMWTQARAGTLHVGDTAPDFSLGKLDKSGDVRLSELNAKQPVVLIFGSYT